MRKFFEFVDNWYTLLFRKTGRYKCVPCDYSWIGYDQTCWYCFKEGEKL